MFRREHHIRIATILQSLKASLLMEHKCLFGGGTAIALAHKEYRESLDIDFLVSDRSGYQSLRQLLTGRNGINAIVRPGMELKSVREIRADQYGIRTMLQAGDAEIKFEIVLEGRVQLANDAQVDSICGVGMLSPLDLGATKLLANSDRWADDSVFSRDLIDLAMLDLPNSLFSQAINKAAGAYGQCIVQDLAKAIKSMSNRRGRLEACMTALRIDEFPRAALWKRIRQLEPST